MTMIVRMTKEELDKMCQEIIDSFDEETFLADKFVHLMSNCDLKIITAANVPENYKEEGHMRKHWQHFSKYLTTLQHAQENLARARARCQCNCRCRRRPGRLVTCDWCGKQVGPGCCLAYEDPMRSFCHWCKPGLVNGV